MRDTPLTKARKDFGSITDTASMIQYSVGEFPCFCFVGEGLRSDKGRLMIDWFRFVCALVIADRSLTRSSPGHQRAACTTDRMPSDYGGKKIFVVSVLATASSVGVSAPYLEARVDSMWRDGLLDARHRLLSLMNYAACALIRASTERCSTD